MRAIHTRRANVMSLSPSQPHDRTGFAHAHNCTFWAAG